MLLKYFEEQVNAPIEIIKGRIIGSTEMIKFGLLDFYKTDQHNFETPWMGSYDYDLHEFRLFRTVRDTDRTSDFYIKGKLLEKAGHTQVRYAIHIHYMQVLGLLGLNLFTYAITFLLVSQGTLDSMLYSVPAAVMLSIGYTLMKIKDYHLTIAAFKEWVTVPMNTRPNSASDW